MECALKLLKNPRHRMKKLPAQVTQCNCYCTNKFDGNFFGAMAKMWLLKCKTSFLPMNG
jgi:hypothetical protein